MGAVFRYFAIKKFLKSQICLLRTKKAGKYLGNPRIFVGNFWGNLPRLPRIPNFPSFLGMDSQFLQLPRKQNSQLETFFERKAGETGEILGNPSFPNYLPSFFGTGVHPKIIFE